MPSWFSWNSYFHLAETPLAWFEVALTDLQFLDPEIKSRWWDLKLGCSSVGTVNSASTFLQRGFNGLPLAIIVAVRGLRDTVPGSLLRGVCS